MKRPIEVEQLTRRDAIGRVAAGISVLSILKEGGLDAQQRPAATATKQGTVNTVLGPIPTIPCSAFGPSKAIQSCSRRNK